VINSRRLRWSGHVTRVVDRKFGYKVLVDRPEGKNQLEDLGVDDMIILKWILGSHERD